MLYQETNSKGIINFYMQVLSAGKIKNSKASLKFLPRGFTI